jgi:hypothetical protein
MEEDRTTSPPQDCCSHDSQMDCSGLEAENGASCAPPRRKTWVKTLIFVIVMLAAVGVGAYSLLTESEPAETIQAPASEGSEATPSEQSALPECSGRQVEAPMSQETPCCGAAGREEPEPPPPCECGGNPKGRGDVE